MIRRMKSGWMLGICASLGLAAQGWAASPRVMVLEAGKGWRPLDLSAPRAEIPGAARYYLELELHARKTRNDEWKKVAENKAELDEQVNGLGLVLTDPPSAARP